MIITKHRAIATALKIHEPTQTRICLVDLIQKVYKNNQELDLDHLCFMLYFLASNLDSELEAPIGFYILCLRLGDLEKV